MIVMCFQVSKCYHDVECALEIDSENSDALEFIQELKTRSDHAKNQVKMDGWMDGRTDGRMDGWMDEWMDGWMD